MLINIFTKQKFRHLKYHILDNKLCNKGRLNNGKRHTNRVIIENYATEMLVCDSAKSSKSEEDVLYRIACIQFANKESRHIYIDLP